jgi:primosomal protein N'
MRVTTVSRALPWPSAPRLAGRRSPHVAARASASTLATASEFRSRRASWIRAPRGVKLLGPAPAAMTKRAARYHAQLLLEARERAPLHRALAAWLPDVESLKAPRDLRWSLDGDPLDLF